MNFYQILVLVLISAPLALCVNVTTPLPGPEGNRQSRGYSLDNEMKEVRKALPAIGRLLRSTGAAAATTTSSLLNINLTSLGVFVTSLLAAFLFYPQLISFFGLVSGNRVSRAETGGSSRDSVMERIQHILETYNIDGDACLKVALCSVGKIRHTKKERNASSTGPVDVLDAVLSLTYMDDMMVKKGLRQAKQYGETGGDCDSFNREDRCPFNASAWKILLSTIN